MVKQLESPIARLQEEDAQTMSEYAVVVGILVLGVIVALGFFSLAVEGRFTSVATTITGLVS